MKGCVGVNANYLSHASNSGIPSILSIRFTNVKPREHPVSRVLACPLTSCPLIYTFTHPRSSIMYLCTNVLILRGMEVDSRQSNGKSIIPVYLKKKPPVKRSE